MSGALLRRTERALLAAIHRFNEAHDAATEADDGAELDIDDLHFDLDQVSQADSSVLAIGRLAKGRHDEADIPLVLAWKIDPGGDLGELTSFSSEADAVAALEPKSPRRPRPSP